MARTHDLSRLHEGRLWVPRTRPGLARLWVTQVARCDAWEARSQLLVRLVSTTAGCHG